jgi:translocation and assembly module TamB
VQEVAKKNQDDFERPVTKKTQRRRRPWRAALLMSLLMLVVVTLFLPKILTSRGILVGLVDRFGGLAPLKLDLDQVQAGWFQPITAQGIQLKDGDGNTLIRIGNIETEKGLLGWAMNSANLGKIRIASVEADIVTYDSTSNIEQALKPLLDRQAAATPVDPDTSSSTHYLGEIEVVDTRFNLSSRDSDQSWILNLPELSVMLPTAGQVIGPIKLQANLGAATQPLGSGSAAPTAFSAIPGTSTDRGGTIAAEVKQTEGQPAFELRAMIDHIPLDFWHVVHARLPELPIESLNGSITAKVAGTIVDANRWSFDVQQMETSRLVVVAPQLVGNNPARFEQIAASGRCTLADARLLLENGVLNCDFGNATAAAQIPWPIVTPSLAQPWLAGAVVDARGSVDLAKLVRTAESLVPMRQDTKLIAGTAQFILTQQNSAAGTPVSSASFELAGLEAIASGQQLSWNEPLKLQVQAGTGADQKIQFGALCEAEFCNLQGRGTLETGAFSGHVDLALLQQRLSQFVDLPIKNMTGSADVKLDWNQSQPGIVLARGELSTTPLLIASSVGGQLSEPAWKGKFSATTRLENNSPAQIDVAQLELTSEQERLTVELREPIRIVASSAEAALPPGSFTVQLAGDLSKWQKRGMAFQALPADLVLGGNVNLGVEGRLDMQHAEVLQATWRMQPFELSSSQVQVSESQMVGNFKGRVDTSDIARLVVEKLEVQATSFSLGATDAADPDGSGGRIGRAGFIADLGKLMKNVQGGARPSELVLPPGSPAPVQTVASGTVEGTLNWQVSNLAASFNLESTGKNVAFESRDAAGTISKIWDEALINAGLGGKYEIASSTLALDTCRFEAPWINYAGTLDYQTISDEQIIKINGKATYDAARVAERIQPWTGGQLQMAGQKTMPVEVVWKGKADSVGSSLAGLQAATRLGWDQARLVGINIGAADVPVSVTNGQFATAAEIPVSGGKVRWDVASDLTAQDMIIYQKPMIVLENVAITPEMCQTWLKYVTPLLADATSVEGRLSLKLDQATFNPSNTRNQTIVGQLLIHSAEVGPGPLSNQIINLVQQINAIRKQDFTQAVSSQKVWVQMPEQKIDFEMINGQVVHRNLNIRAGDVTISTSGTVDIDGRMELLATMPIPDDWVEKSQWLAGMRGQSLQFPVRGTLTGPQMDLQLLKQFGRQQIQQAASGLIQQQLTRGLGKLFGPAPQQPPAQPPAQGPTGP